MLGALLLGACTVLFEYAPEAEGPPRGDTDAGADGDADSDADADSDTDADVDSDGDADSDADGDGDSDADSDADADRACEAPQLENEPCGDRCGTHTRTCQEDGTWGPYNACTGEGDCIPFSRETERGCLPQGGGGEVGTQERHCLIDCTWSEWSTCA